MTNEVVNSLVLLGIAAFNATSAVVGWLAMRSAKRSEANIQIVHEATNSMKDALVAAAQDRGFRQGAKAERVAAGSEKTYIVNPDA
jgi:hypothetical protein